MSQNRFSFHIVLLVFLFLLAGCFGSGSDSGSATGTTSSTGAGASGLPDDSNSGTVIPRTKIFNGTTQSNYIPNFVKYVLDGEDVYALVIGENWTYTIMHVRNTFGYDVLHRFTAGSFYFNKKLPDFDVKKGKLFYAQYYRMTPESAANFDCQSSDYVVDISSTNVFCLYEQDATPQGTPQVVTKLVDDFSSSIRLTIVDDHTIYAALIDTFHKTGKLLELENVSGKWQITHSVSVYYVPKDLFVVRADDGRFAVVDTAGYVYQPDLTLRDSFPGDYDALLVTDDAVFLAEKGASEGSTYVPAGKVLKATVEGLEVLPFAISKKEDLVQEILGLRFTVKYDKYHLAYLYINDQLFGVLYSGESLETFDYYRLSGNFLTWYSDPCYIKGVWIDDWQ